MALVKQRRANLQQHFARILPAQAKFVWEIGCGHGHFLAAYATAYPEKLCIGVDIATERIDRANRKRDRAKLANLHFIQAEARAFINSLPTGATFDDIYVLFPDPWPKLRHRKHRLLQPDFLHLAAAKAGQGARLLFRTDYQPYFNEVAEVLGRQPGWMTVDEPWPFEHETVFQSRAAQYRSLVARPS